MLWLLDRKIQGSVPRQIGQIGYPVPHVYNYSWKTTILRRLTDAGYISTTAAAQMRDTSPQLRLRLIWIESAIWSSVRFGSKFNIELAAKQMRIQRRVLMTYHRFSAQAWGRWDKSRKLYLLGAAPYLFQTMGTWKNSMKTHTSRFGI